MDKVYIVCFRHWDNFYIEKVFSTERAAKEHIKTLLEPERYDIYEEEVND